MVKLAETLGKQDTMEREVLAAKKERKEKCALKE